MVKKQAELMEDGKINLKVKAGRLVEYLEIPNSANAKFYSSLDDWRYTVRQFCESSEEELVKHFDADQTVLDAINEKLPTVGLHLGMKKIDFDLYKKSGKIQNQPTTTVARETIEEVNIPKFSSAALKHATPKEAHSQSKKENTKVPTTKKNETIKPTKVKPKVKTPSSSAGSEKYVKPYGDTERTRRNMMFFRASDDEKASLEAAADKCGMKPSAYIRSQVLGKTPREAFTPEERQLFMDNLEILTNVRQMRNYFNNNRQDPNVWKQLTFVVDYMSKKIQELKK